MHKEITQKQRQQPFYYSRWYYCENDDCPRETFMNEEDRVYNDPAARNMWNMMREEEERLSLFNQL